MQTSLLALIVTAPFIQQALRQRFVVTRVAAAAGKATAKKVADGR